MRHANISVRQTNKTYPNEWQILIAQLPLPGLKPQKHILRPGSEDGTADDETDDPVCALEWDTLSVDYLLMANTQSGVRLIDASGQQAGVIMTFTLPSAAAQVHTLAWISSAPGMFVTGGRKKCFVLF